MAVDPSAPMLEACRRRVAEIGIADRCEFHVGYVDSLPAGEPFDGATSLLVSQFIHQPEARCDFFRQIAQRLRTGGMLASTDLSGDRGTASYNDLLETWLRLMRLTDITDEQVEGMRRAYARDVAIWPVDEVSEIIATAGVDPPTRFYQAGMIHGWYARRRAD